MVEIRKISKKEALEMLRNHPSRRPGRWNSVIAEAKSSEDVVTVSDLSRGSAWHLARRAKSEGLFARVIGGTTVIISKTSLE